MKKKILTLTLCVAMLATVAVSGTLAYFSDTEQATNTMTIGNVEINIEEYTHDGTDWHPFVDDEFTLYPLANDVGYNMNANKVVHTFNTSDSEDDAYIRTIVLFEANDLLDDTYVPEDDCCFPGLHYTYHTADTKTSSDGHAYHGSKNYDVGKVTVDGNNYWAVVFEEKNGEAIKYDEALYSLAKVWLDKNITQDQIAGWYDYDANGNCINTKVDIVVFSQGIQAEGLKHNEAMAALGTVTAEKLNEWIDADDAKINDLDYKKVNP